MTNISPKIRLKNSNTSFICVDIFKTAIKITYDTAPISFNIAFISLLQLNTCFYFFHYTPILVFCLTGPLG